LIHAAAHQANVAGFERWQSAVLLDAPEMHLDVGLDRRKMPISFCLRYHGTSCCVMQLTRLDQ
jgi:hypothetical protein